MGLLFRTKVYLVGGMQYVSDGRSWRQELTDKLATMGITVFDPYIKPFIDDVEENESVRAELKEQMLRGEFDAVAERMKKIRNFDLRLCDLSDFIIANINPSIASWGSAEEIVTATRSKKPIFISVEGGKSACPLWILGMIPQKYIYNNVSEIFDTIKRIDAEEKIIDSDRWKLLKTEFR